VSDELLRVGLLWLLRSRLRRWWRRLLIWLGIKRITPRAGELRPSRLVVVEELRDTGGVYRPKHRPQDPAKDPDEPYGSESSSRGQDHGWSGCTMAAGADAFAYQTHGDRLPWGGTLRHHQSDLEGGTDLYDLRDAWAAMGEELKVRSGAGWSALVDAHGAGRAIVVQGTGQVPGAGDFDGGHACSIGVETRSSDGAWLFGDPLCTDWQWIAPGSIRTWAERWQSSIAFATTTTTTEPEPAPTPPPAPPPAPCYSEAELDAAVDRAVDNALTLAGDEAVSVWLEWLREPRPLPADRWDRGAWADPELELEAIVDGDEEPDPCEPTAPASWSRGPMPDPVDDALDALLLTARWDSSAWRAAAWRPPETAGRRSR